MDDIGNLVYILVFVIWFLYKIFGKGKKKTTRPLPPLDQGAPAPQKRNSRESTSPPMTSPPMTFEDVLRELTGTPPVKVVEPVEIDETPAQYPIEDIPPTMEETSFEVYETPPETQPAAGLVIAEKTSKSEVQHKRSSKAARGALKMLRTKQGAKQAFIMKEIFDRKY